jgi:3-dehydrosphinganine reductase
MLMLVGLTPPFSVNFMGTVNSIKAAYASVTRKPGGIIVLVSSQAGQVGVFGYTAYSASKFALRGLAEALQVCDLLRHKW